MNATHVNAHRSWLPVMAAFLALTIEPSALAQGYGRGASAGPVAAAPVLPLPENQAKTLQFMREEEKLARDVYQQLYEKWQLTVFRNIAESESAHFRSVGVLLTRYQVADPAADQPAGVYRDARLTALYSQLMAKGNVSVKDALEVGILVEKTDIADLETSLALTDRTDIKRVFTNLMNASYSHQEAFEMNVELVCNLGL